MSHQMATGPAADAIASVTDAVSQHRRESRDEIRKAFEMLMAEKASVDTVLDSIAEMTEQAERERQRIEQLAGEKASAKRVSALPIHTDVRQGTADNPWGLNAEAPAPRCLVLPPFKTHDEHDKFMARLVQGLDALEQMGTNAMTNNPHWVLEGEAVGMAARSLRNALFPVSKPIKKKSGEAPPDRGLASVRG